MMGGLWGIRKRAGLNLHTEYASYKEDVNLGHRVGHDQNFLSDVLYPKLVGRMLVHYSNGRRKLGETAVEFPFEWSNDTYCGRIELEYLEYPEPPRKRQLGLPEVRIRVRDAIPEAPTPAVPTPTFSIKQPANPTLNFLPRR